MRCSNNRRSISSVSRPPEFAETKDPGDVALDDALVRQCDGIDEPAQKAALREATLAAGTICRRAAATNSL
ncbi:MAG: hypothetical protein WAR76_25650 [Xanthobacteraceae bacterium]